MLEAQAPNKQQEFFDTLSRSSNAYVAKHGNVRPKRMQSASASSKGHSRFTRTTKSFYPDEYFKRVGYQVPVETSKYRVDALGQRVRERFNEDLSYTDNVKTRGLEKRQLQYFDTEKKAINKTNSQAAMSSASRADIFSRASGNLHGRRPTNDG